MSAITSAAAASHASSLNHASTTGGTIQKVKPPSHQASSSGATKPSAVSKPSTAGRKLNVTA
jgi:hypothetical protein